MKISFYVKHLTMKLLHLSKIEDEEFMTRITEVMVDKALREYYDIPAKTKITRRLLFSHLNESFQTEALENGEVNFQCRVGGGRYCKGFLLPRESDIEIKDIFDLPVRYHNGIIELAMCGAIRNLLEENL